MLDYPMVAGENGVSPRQRVDVDEGWVPRDEDSLECNVNSERFPKVISRRDTGYFVNVKSIWNSYSYPRLFKLTTSQSRGELKKAIIMGEFCSARLPFAV